MEALLDALGSQTVLPDEIVVVDDGSTDDSAGVIRRWSSANTRTPARVVAGPGRGPGPAMNAGILATSADVIVRLDGHSVPDANYIEHSIAGLADARAGVVGGGWKVQPGAETRMARAIADVVSHPLGSGGALYRHPDSAGPVTVRVETVPFGSFRRELWKQLGGFDESLSANQDFDFNYRVRKAGLDVVFDRRISATYTARPTLATLSRQYFRYGYWKRQMLRKDVQAIHWRQVPPMLLVPWVLATGVMALLWPSPLSGVAAGLYPAVLTAGAVLVARRGASALAAFTALATL
ncbi:MAG TPA: glycosyltransferase, partial [Vicinamibacterales bacterium]|nr:glycosyltransferase [Vicinamibacterales bacterium]